MSISWMGGSNEHGYKCEPYLKDIWVKMAFTYLKTNVAQHYHIMVKELQIDDEAPISENFGLILIAMDLIL